jgi:hypothetical protein
MLTLASLLVTAILAPAPTGELRNPMGSEVAPTTAAATEAAATSCPCKCADADLREPAFPRTATPRAAARTLDPSLRDPFDSPRRATMAPAPILRNPSPARPVRPRGPRPMGPGDELRSPFGRA